MLKTSIQAPRAASAPLIARPAAARRRGPPPRARPAASGQGSGKSLAKGGSKQRTAQGPPPCLPPEVAAHLQPDSEPLFMGLYTSPPGPSEEEEVAYDVPDGRYITVASGPTLALLYKGPDTPPGEEGGPMATSTGNSAAAELAAQLGMEQEAVEALVVEVELTGPEFGGVPPALLLQAVGVEGRQRLPCVGFACLGGLNHSMGSVVVATDLSGPQLLGDALGHLTFDRLTKSVPKEVPVLPDAPDPSTWAFWRESAALKEQLGRLVAQCGVDEAQGVCCQGLGWGEELFASLV